MDLKDVIEKVKVFADEASNAFHAGHQDTAKDNLYLIEQTVVEYLRIEATPEGGVTESATSENPDEANTSKLAEDLGMLPVPQPSHPGAVVQTPGDEQAKEKPAQ